MPCRDSPRNAARSVCSGEMYIQKPQSSAAPHVQWSRRQAAPSRASLVFSNFFCRHLPINSFDNKIIVRDDNHDSSKPSAQSVKGSPAKERLLSGFTLWTFASEQICLPDAPACFIQRSAPYGPPRKQQLIQCRCLPSAGCVCMRACVCVHSSPSSSPPVPSPYSPAHSSQPPQLPAARGISRQEVGSTTPKRAVKPAMRGGSVGSASAAAPRGVNPFDARRCALIQLLDLPGEVEGKVGSSQSVHVGVRGYRHVHGGSASMSQRQAGLRQC